MAAPEQLEVHKELDGDELVQQLKDSKFLTPDEIERVTEKHPGATVKDLAGAFVDAGLLTKHQLYCTRSRLTHLAAELAPRGTSPAAK